MMPATGALRRVVYVSHTLRDEADMQTTLDAILSASRRNNPRLGVTGALLYSARRFAQVLEGPPDAVEEIFEVIQCDPRHDTISVLEVSAPTERAFGDWSMAFTEAPQVTSTDFDAPDAAVRLVGVLRAAIRNTEAATARAVA